MPAPTMATSIIRRARPRKPSIRAKRVAPDRIGLAQKLVRGVRIHVQDRVRQLAGDAADGRRADQPVAVGAEDQDRQIDAGEALPA